MAMVSLEFRGHGLRRLYYDPQPARALRFHGMFVEQLAFSDNNG
ncbi:MAG TPA: hypothetical protein VMT67_06190 [Terriglobales bacterium]|nr:hypothetical protein [Terriglobales bacterium]